MAAKKKSSVIEAFVYDGDRLVITFTSGTTYAYDGVPKRTVTGLAKAASQGSYFHKHIKDKFPTTNITEE